METLKKSLVIILGVLLISSFVSNIDHSPANKSQLLNGEKNIELIKKLLKEEDVKDVHVFGDYIGTSFMERLIKSGDLSFDDIYVVAKSDEKSIIYFEAEKISYVRKEGKRLMIRIN